MFFSLFTEKAKTEEKPEQYWFIIFYVKIRFAQKNKKYLTTFYFKFYFLPLFFYVLGRFMQIFKKQLIFIPLICLKMETLPRMRCVGARPKLPIIWNWTHKNLPDQETKKRVGFQKSKKVLDHSTLLQYIYYNIVQ